MVFYGNDWCNLRSHHNHPLHVTVKVIEVELKRAILDQGSSFNVISLPVLDILVVPRDNILGSRSRCQGFGGKCTYTLGFVNLDLK